MDFKKLGIGLAAVLGMAVILSLLHQTWLVVLIMIAAIAFLAFGTIKRTAASNQEDARDQMDAESRTLFAPVRRITSEIEEIVSRHSDSAVMKVVGGEAVDEARRIRDQVAKALSVRDDLKRALRERNLAKAQIENMRKQADASTIPAEKASLLSALEARELELKHYEEVDRALAQIDSQVSLAQSALAEMKARLAVKASSEKAAVAGADEQDLRETIGHLKALSVSYDEAEQLISGGS